MLQKENQAMNQEEVESVNIDLGRVLADPDPGGTRPRRNMQARNDPRAEETLDERLLQEALEMLDTEKPIVLEHAIRNTDRTVGARLSGEIARRYGDSGLPTGTIVARLSGTAGQSFGAFLIEGVQLWLWGEANDYVGKGMCGGEIVIRPPRTARWATQENFIIGNTVLYGATGGTLLAAGRAGERFAVRNSGATAVVEGVGDHGCEYMTGGTVVVLGATGRNFGAGMTGGTAFVFDPEEKLPARLNPEMVTLSRVENPADDSTLWQLVRRHVEATDSAWAGRILADWTRSRERFWQVIPKG